MTFEQLKAEVIDLQNRMKPLNHKLENPRIKHNSRCAIESELRILKIFWYDAMCDMHAHPGYDGKLAYQKENNPFR